MDKEKKPVNYPRKIARILLKTILFLLLFILVIFLLILTPPVQRFMTGKVENYLQDKLNTRVDVGRISFGLSGNISLRDIYIEDQSKDTLISGGTIRANLNLFKLFSNEVLVKDLELQNITAKIKRTLPDTVFNFQFIVDAFTTPPSADTSQTAPMKLAISDLSLDNIRLIYTDVVSGSDMFAHIGNLTAAIDTLDPYLQHYNISSVIARNVQATIKQLKPLVTPEPESKDIAEAATPVAMKLSIGSIDLSKINVQYANEVSEFYSTVNIGQFKAEERALDLTNNKVWLDELLLNNSRIDIRLGKKETAVLLAKEVKQEVKAEAQAGWDIRVGNIQMNSNRIAFDNDNEPRVRYGMDFNHLLGEELTLHIQDFIMNEDSIGGKILKGSFTEKNGFELQALQGNMLYSNQQAYLKDLYIKTPGSEIRRSAMMHYASYEALAENFPQTQLDIELVDSRVQVKDILNLAPQLRSNPALANPEDVWYFNIVGSGTLNRLHLESLQFDGLGNTVIDAHGTLVGLMEPQNAGGNFIIDRLHTTQTDIALFTGQRLSTPDINLPEEFDIRGSISGNAGSLQTNLNVNTTAGSIAVNGKFSNLANPEAIVYNAQVRTNGLRLGSIIRQPEQFGNVTGNFRFNGKGITPNSINTKFTGNVGSFGYNRYQYRNIKLDGSLNGSVFNVNANINDPNADLNVIASGNFSDDPSFNINGMIDSIKTMPLHFTTSPFIFRGKIDGTVSNITSDNMDADVLITKALLVSDKDRLPLDSVQLLAGTNANGNYISFKSDVANAYISGQYRLSELAGILQNSIEPYFSVTPPSRQTPLQPYDFTFRADIAYAPIMSSFVPGLTTMETLHASGSFSSDSGMHAQLTTPYILFNGKELSNLSLNANTSDRGLEVTGNVARIKQGNGFDIFNTRINATAMNNVIDFNLGIDDLNAKNKYYLSGIVTQPASGTYSIKLNPDSLLLNYEPWTISPDNYITIGPDVITANNFMLQKGNQSLSLNSIAGNGQPLQVNFNNFRVSTITGFVKSDSLLVDGVMNGEVTFRNLMTTPVFTSNLNINDLSLKQDTIGNVNLQVSSGTGNRYITNATITGRGNDISLTGSFAPAGNDINLDLDLNVRQLQLNTMEGAFAQAITNASGSIDGNVSIRGTTAAPDINGDLNFNNASFSFTMLGSQFRINNETLSVTEEGFVFDDFTIRDSVNNTLVLDGIVLTSNFINYDFDLQVNATNFQVLNSTKEQNKIYYGKLNITSDLNITGTEIRPVVDGSVTVNDGTNLFVVIPQEEPGVVERKGVVEFVDFDAPENDSLFLEYDSLNISSVLGFDIAANIEIKKEAIFNVIVDEANGDFLNVQGEALLSAGIDPSGKITLVGNYTLEQGAYQLSFNFLQRKFDIEKGSTITWTGEPTTALLNVKAIYIANTSPIDLVVDQLSPDANKNIYLQKLPFEVHLNLTGELMKPIVDFDIVLPEGNYGISNEIITTVDTRLNMIRQDEGEINKQVFSLLLLNRFVGENPFESSGAGFSFGTYARQSVSRLLTEQLNQLAAGLINGVDLNFDVVSTEDYTTGNRRSRTDLNIGLSKRLLNDRLTVTVGSNFQLEGETNSNQQSNNIAGNIAVDYQLSRDGRYMIRFYRQNEYQGIVDGYIIETGLSFILSVDYNRFMELFRKRRPRQENTSGTN